MFNFLNRVIMDTLKNKNPGYLPGNREMWFKTSYSAMKPFAFSAAMSASLAGPNTVPFLLTV